MELNRVLVGIDGSAASAAAERWAADAVRESGGEVIALHVVGSPLLLQATEDVVNGLGMTHTRMVRARRGLRSTSVRCATGISSVSLSLVSSVTRICPSRKPAHHAC